MPAKKNNTAAAAVSTGELEIQAHLQRVGCRTMAEYQAWCAQNGLGSNVRRKGKHERDREAALYARLIASDVTS